MRAARGFAGRRDEHARRRAAKARRRPTCVIWLLGTVFLSLGLVNLDFSRGWWRGQLRRLAVGVPLVAAFCYLTMPQLVFPQAISLLLLTLLPNVLITSLTAARTMVISRRIVSLRRTPVWPLIVAVGAVGLFA